MIYKLDGKYMKYVGNIRKYEEKYFVNYIYA